MLLQWYMVGNNESLSPNIPVLIAVFLHFDACPPLPITSHALVWLMQPATGHNESVTPGAYVVHFALQLAACPEKILSNAQLSQSGRLLTPRA